MMEPPPELVAAVIAASAHDAHWVAHGAGAFSLEDILGLMDGLGHLEGGVVRGLAWRDGWSTPEAWVRGASSRPCARHGPGGQPHAVPGVAHGVGSGGSCGGRCGWVRRSSGSTSRSCCTKAGRIGSRPDDLAVRAATAPRGRCRVDHRALDPCRGWHQGAAVVMTETLTGWRSTSPEPVDGSGRARSASMCQVPRSGATCRSGHRQPTSMCSTFGPWVGSTTPSPRQPKARRSPTTQQIPPRRRRPDHRPSSRWLPRQPKARGTSRRPDVHQPTAV